MELGTHITSTANWMNRGARTTDPCQGSGPYAQSKLPPEIYVGDSEENPMGWPGVPLSLTCCCCSNAGKFETINTREESLQVPWCQMCCDSLTRKEGDDIGEDVLARDDRVRLGRRGWRVCIRMALLPAALPCRAFSQHKRMTALYPVESTQEQVRRYRRYHQSGPPV